MDFSKISDFLVANPRKYVMVIIMDIIEQMKMLMELGYIPAPEKRTFGGPYCFTSPDGRTIWEQDFEKELLDFLES
jgi:hypothetical protein